ncbi:MAG: 4-(cytidine 5'-diphospho)-2-C-methyl-D-erythritol kinase [Ferruginibacter sp.]
MVLFPNCKINIGLRVVNKRSDGYHDIETIFFPLALKDAVEVIEEPATIKEVSYTQTGLKIPGSDQDNLCIKAYQLLKKDLPKLPNVKLHLHKIIPTGAGLGGGSADASFVLKLLNEKFKLDLSVEQLLAYALQLGSDCPFFIINKPCYATGRGEMLEEIPLNLSAYKILLLNPCIHINTGWAFSNINIEPKEGNLKELCRLPVTSWQENIFNDFEKPVFEAHPEIAKIKNTLINAGALYASMSGSGSTLYGIFEKKTEPVFKFPADYFWKWV